MPSAPIRSLRERNRKDRVRAVLVIIRVLASRRRGISFWIVERNRIESQFMWDIIITSHC